MHLYELSKFCRAMLKQNKQKQISLLRFYSIYSARNNANGKVLHNEEIVEKNLNATDSALQLENAKRMIDNLKIESDMKKKLKDDLEAAHESSLQHAYDQSQMTPETNWTSCEFPWSEEMMKQLKSTFNNNNLHSIQLKVVNATMSDRDVLVVLPTGGGKSLCYQLPAVLSKGITIVISPLISLMTDQVLALRKIGIKAEMLHSSSSLLTLLEVFNEMESAHPSLKLLYVTPERISQSRRFLSQLDKCYRMGNLARIAIDEVHCVEHWGNNFRPDYRNLGILKRHFPDVPLLGLTATATSHSLEEVKKTLNMRNSLEFISFYPRHNLYYEVRSKPGSAKQVILDIAKLIKSNFNNQSGIIYCLSRSNCESVCKGLQEHSIEAAIYHSAMSNKARKDTQKKWLNGEKKVICATNAFGMGINKLDVRFVIHHSLSKSMETYYQETGRAGRDGLPALCLLYYGFADVFRNVGLVLKEHEGVKKLKGILKYSQNMSRCRHKALAEIFGADISSCSGMCDLCSGGYSYSTYDVTQTCICMLDMVQLSLSKGEKLTGRQLIEKMKKKTSVKEDLENCIIQMLIDGYFKMSCHIYLMKNISYIIPGPNARFLKFNKIEIHRRNPIVDLDSMYLSAVDKLV